MNNHNFASWELTKMLPEKNPYKSNIAYMSFVWANTHPKDDNNCFIINSGESHLVRKIRDAWTWEDIRLYLLEKGYLYTLLFTAGHPEHYVLKEERLYWYYTVTSVSTFETTSDFKYFNTYNEAREEAIKHCVTLINDGARENL